MWPLVGPSGKPRIDQKLFHRCLIIAIGPGQASFLIQGVAKKTVFWYIHSKKKLWKDTYVGPNGHVHVRDTSTDSLQAQVDNLTARIKLLEHQNCELINEKGQLISQKGRLIDQNGQLVATNAKLTDEILKLTHVKDENADLRLQLQSQMNKVSNGIDNVVFDYHNSPLVSSPNTL